MKHLIITKQTSTIQLGHLYEHLFCAHVSNMFRQNSLFPHLDYWLDAKTYYGGVIVIDIELYSDASIKLAKSIPTSTISPNKEGVALAMCQLVAEKEMPFASSGYDAIVQALEELDAVPWLPIDDIGIIDTKGYRRKQEPLYITDGTALKARKLKTSVVVGAEFTTHHQNLIPLFRQIALLIISTLQEDIANTYGLYSLDDTYTSNQKRVAVTNIFNVPKLREANPTTADIAAACKQIITELQEKDAFNRFLGQLRNTSYSYNPDTAPNIQRNYEQTLTIVGAKGWQRIATEENCKTILKHVLIEVSLGRDKQILAIQLERDDLAIIIRSKDCAK